jgi:hypothetical protein
MPLTNVTPIAFSFFDGQQTITNIDATSYDFEFETGPTGAITGWGIAIRSTGQRLIITENDPVLAVDDDGRLAQGQFGDNTGSPGTWTSPAQGVPDTGCTLSLMTLTLMALGVAARQFKRAAA